jgi:hypothetical protein
VILLLQRKWRFMQGFIAIASVLGLLSLVAVGWRDIVGYVHLISAAAAHPESSSYGNFVGMSTVGGFINPPDAGNSRASCVIFLDCIHFCCWLADLAVRVQCRARNALDAAAFLSSACASLVLSLVSSLDGISIRHLEASGTCAGRNWEFRCPDSSCRLCLTLVASQAIA